MPDDITRSTTTVPRDLRAAGIFVVAVFILAWIVYLPALIGGDDPSSPAYSRSAQIYMFGPALVAVVMGFIAWRRPRRVLHGLGILPIRRRRVGVYCLVAFGLFVLIGLVAPLVAGAFGVIDLDLQQFSGLRAAIAELVPAAAQHLSPEGFPALAYVIALGSLIGVSFPLSLPLMIGEEIGWRGFLFPQLLGLGIWPALITSGLVHALWHGPQLFIQARSDMMSPASLLLFIVQTTAFGVLLGWLRLASASVWPAVIAHGANNVVAQLGFLTFSAADSRTDPLLYSGGTGGLIGLGVVLLTIVVLACTGQFRTRPFEHVTSSPSR